MKVGPKQDLRQWREKSLEELEGAPLGPPAFDSYLVQTVHRLHQKPVGQFGIEDLRIMIGQGRGLTYLVPLATEWLEKDPFAEGDFYEGDLLSAVLGLEASYWIAHKAELQRISLVAERSLERLDSLDTTEEIRDSLRAAANRLITLRAPAV